IANTHEFVLTSNFHFMFGAGDSEHDGFAKLIGDCIVDPEILRSLVEDGAIRSPVRIASAILWIMHPRVVDVFPEQWESHWEQWGRNNTEAFLLLASAGYFRGLDTNEAFRRLISRTLLSIHFTEKQRNRWDSTFGHLREH